MITTIAAVLGISDKTAKLIAIAGTLALVIAIITGVYWTGKSAGKAQIRAEYAELALKSANAARAASEQATADKDSRDSDFALEQRELSDAVIEAERNGGDPVNEYFIQLRKAQSANREAAAK